MHLEQKKAFVEDIRGRLDGSPFVVLTDFKGSTVSQMNDLRRACEPLGVHFRVVKNSLCRRAVTGTSCEGLGEHFRGNVAVFVAGEDPIAAAKLLKKQLKENKNLVVRVGFFEGEVLDADAVVAVAALPSREELLCTLMRTIQEGPRQILGVLQGNGRDLVYLLSNHANELENSGD